MTVPFAALSIHSFVNSVGAYVGLGSIIAVALLVLLYFAHARETATLRDRLDEAQQRIGGLEARIAQLMQAQASSARRVPAPVPSPVVPARPPVSAGAVRRVPSPVTAAAGATAAAAAAAPNRQVAGVTWAPAGTAAPALASATKLIPDPVAAGPGDPEDTVFVPAAAVAAANGQTAAARAQAVSPATQAMPVAAAAAAAASRPPAASPRGAVAAPPRMQIAPEGAGAATAAGSSPGSKPIRRIGGNRGSSSAAPVLPAFDNDAPSGRFAGRLLPLLIGGIAAAVIIAGLIVITNTGNGTTGGQASHNSTTQTGAGLHNQKKTPVPFVPAKETVAVLNGTAQAGLAGDVGNKLSGKGYRKGNITNAANQTQAHTFVYYRAGKANRVAAQHVARALSLAPSRVRQAGRSVLDSCAVSPTGASLGNCTANVIVSVGQDRVNLASGGSSG
jgi:hypothetical protein